MNKKERIIRVNVMEAILCFTNLLSLGIVYWQNHNINIQNVVLEEVSFKLADLQTKYIDLEQRVLLGTHTKNTHG